MSFSPNILSRIPRPYLLCGGALLLVLALFLGVKFLLWSMTEGEAGGSSASGLTPRNISTQVGGAGNPEYNQMIDELNRAVAELAREGLDSFVATPVGTPAKKAQPSIASTTPSAPAQPGLPAQPAQPASPAKTPELIMSPQPMAKPVSGPRTEPPPPVRVQDDQMLSALLNDLKTAGQVKKELGTFASAPGFGSGGAWGPAARPHPVRHYGIGRQQRGAGPHHGQSGRGASGKGPDSSAPLNCKGRV